MIPLLRPSTQSPGIRWQFFRDIGAIPVVVLLITGFSVSWVAYDEYRQAKESEYRLLEAHARNADAQVADALDRVERLLRRIAAQIAGAQQRNHSLHDKDFSGTLGQYREDIPELGTLLLTDDTGRIRSATDAALVGRDISSETYFSVHTGRTPKLFLSRPDKKLLSATAAVFTLPIVGADNRLLGIVGVTIGFGFFPKVLQAINPDDSASMSVIFNREGDLLLRRESPEKFFGYNIVKVSTIFHEHADAGIAVTRHIGPSLQNGQTRLFLVRDVGDTGLGLILSRQLDEVLVKWRRNAIIYALIFLFTTTVVTFLAIASARNKRQVLAGKAFADQLIATANVIVVGLDAACRITIFNETAERITGFSRNEVLGRNWFELAVVPKDSSGVREMFDQFHRGGDLPHISEYPILTKSGQEHIISWQNSVILEPRAAISFGIDVTERRQMVGALAAAKQKAEDANAAKSKFLAAASHDLRQPIHAQGLFMGVLGRTELNPYQREVLASANAASKSSVEMLNTLLDFSRIEAGVVEPQIQAFRLQPLLNKIEREFGPQADAKGLAYRSRETGLAVWSDPMLVELILRNLVSNAIRYTEQGGLLVACRKRGDQAWLEVWDTGIGIAQAYQQEVFSEFHQLGNPERDSRKGLGLGLAIAEGLANTLGHKLSLVSTPQRGSVFRLSLPIITAIFPVEELGSTQNMTRLHNLRVLVLDDDEFVRAAMLHVLRGWGCSCNAAGSITEALDLARIFPPDLLICDYRLREHRSGLEAIAALRALLGNALPALLITGDTAPDRLREAQFSGIPVMHKPVAPGQLYRELVTLLPH